MHLIVRALLLALAGLAFQASANPMLWTFSGDVYRSTNGVAPCPGLCGSIVPPRGPITFTMVLDQVSAVETFSGVGAPVKWYTMGGLSNVDFGYGPLYRLPEFIVSVSDNDFGSGEPDQLDIFTLGGRGQFFKGAAFSIHLGSLGTELLNGLALPSSLDLALTDNPRGFLAFSETGATADAAQFTLDRLTITEMPEPNSIALILLGLGAVLGSVRRKVSR